MQHSFAVAFLSSFFIWLAPGQAEPRRLMVEVELRSRRLEGSPVAWSSGEILLLARDGRLWNFAASEVRSFQKRESAFSSLSHGELRAELAGEFGRRFEVSGTGHFLVVHPRGQRDRWASRFEQLYRSFVHYFTARGFRVAPLDFPLVAVVCHDKAEFLRQARKDGGLLSGATLGYYSSETNRILLYDVTEGRQVSDDAWHVNAETIIHEAAHQAAFNCGIHSRYAVSPRWIVEGIGTMFEAPGVWNARQFTSRKDRINRDQLARFQRLNAGRRSINLAEFVSSDRPFNTNIDAAYAKAWALSFFLVETRPRQYLELLRRTAELEPLDTYRSPERLRDFTQIVGQNLSLFEAHFLRFMNEIDG